MRIYTWIATPCEHCDGERQDERQLEPSGTTCVTGLRQSLGRLDGLRGYVCQECDSSLDELLGEEPE